MCDSIIDGDIEIETIGALKSWLETRSELPSVVHEEWVATAPADTECLCSVDVPGTLRKNGIPFEWDWCFYYVMKGGA
jgi:hypothetical protein